MKLTAIAIKNAKPREKPYKIADGMGLYLLIKPKGKYWRYDYRYLKKRKTLALGKFPDVSLREARDAHYQAKKLLNNGVDPAHERKIAKSMKLYQAGNTFAAIAFEWLDTKKPSWVDSHFTSVKGRLENHALEYIGNRPITEITAPELLMMIKRIEAKGFYETAHRVRSVCGQVFRYAITTGRAELDPAQSLIDSLVPVEVTSFAAITDPIKLGELLRVIEGYSGDYVTRSALRLAPLVFLRPKELRSAEWCEFNFDKSEWLIPAKKMKMKADHIVPLSKQAVEILLEVKKLTGGEKYVFPSIRSKARPMSENTINGALRRMGYTKEEVTGHGFRATASTLLNEQGYNFDWIEVQLAHAERNKVRAAYNRAKYLPQRKKMMQEYSDYLYQLRNNNNVVCLSQMNQK